MADGVWKDVYPWVFGHFKQLSLNKFFDPSTPSMRKEDDGEEKRRKKKENNDACQNADQLERRSLVPIFVIS